jgi:hypothetical protein
VLVTAKPARAGGTTVVPIVKPTPVCEHGCLLVSV